MAVTPHTHFDGVEFFKSGVLIAIWLLIFTVLASIFPDNWIGKFFGVIK